MVFHPRERRVVGFIVKRPDLALMFHRKDLFVQLQGFDMVDGRVVLRQSPDATDKGACKALGIDYDSCVMWEGLPLMTESGETLGMVGTVTFDRETGTVNHCIIEYTPRDAIRFLKAGHAFETSRLPHSDCGWHL